MGECKLCLTLSRKHLLEVEKKVRSELLVLCVCVVVASQEGIGIIITYVRGTYTGTYTCTSASNRSYFLPLRLGDPGTGTWGGVR